MKLYGGIDLHSNNSVISIKDENGQLKVRKKLANDLPIIIQFLSPFKDALEGLAIESTFKA